MFELRLLNTLELRSTDGRQLAAVVRQPKRAALLAYLACARPRGFQRRDLLLALFWPDSDEQRARNALNTALSYLRHEFGPNVFTARGDEDVGLSTTELWCDVTAFEEAIESGRLEDALGLYRNDLLEGFHVPEAPGFGEWLERERARLRARAANAASTMAERLGAEGAAARAIDFARRAISLAPDDEGLRRALIALLDAAGDRAGALRAYDDFASWLRTEFDSEPAAETRALLQAIRARDAPRAAPLAFSTPSSIAGVSQPRRRRARLVVSALAALLAVGFVASRVVSSRTADARKTASRELRLAVLPFRNLGPVADEYFADGITYEITTRLTGFGGLSVISPTSTIQYKGAQKPLRQIADELNADYILEGTIRWQRVPGGAARVVVTPQLVRPSDDAQLWAHGYDVAMTEVFAVQSNIAQQVAGALGVAFRRENPTSESPPTNNLEAYDYYLRGLLYYDRGHGPQDVRIAERMFERAVALDPSFALAHARLARAHLELYWFGYDPSTARAMQGQRAAQRALELDPDLAEAHTAMGFYHYMARRDYPSALKEFTVALRRQPSSADVLSAIGFVYRRQSRFDRALPYLESAARSDPRSARVLANLGVAHELMRNFSEAHRNYDRAIALSPAWPSPYERKALLYVQETGKTAEARAVLDSALRHIEPFADHSLAAALIWVDMYERDYRRAEARLAANPVDGLSWQLQFLPRAQVLAEIAGLLGRHDRMRAYYDSARRVLEDTIRTLPADNRMHAALGIAYAGIGRKAEAIEAGRRATQLMPFAKDVWIGGQRILDLAHIYVMVGEFGLATEQLESLLVVPSPLSSGLLRVDPRWDPLRRDQRFQRLLERY